MTTRKRWHKTPHADSADIQPFPKPGTIWRPLHKTPHNDNGPVSIRRFIGSKRKPAKN